MTAPKRLVAVALTAFGAIAVYILAAGLVFNRGNGSGASPPVLRTPAAAATSQPGQNATSAAIPASEVAKHNSSKDCWIIIQNKVYNVTVHLRTHPGGAGLITPYCGKEATQAFQTKGGLGGNHSSRAYAQLTPLYVGDLAP
ncbi:MAG: cytochrome b5 domain-containing protein [Dehalococcoidia bacterium]